MRRTVWGLSIVLFALLESGDAAAADAEVAVALRAIPSEVQVGDTFSLEVRADVKGGSLESLTLADLKRYPELEIISHQTSRPMQVSFGFGRGMEVSSSLSHMYTMRALAPGKYEFSPAVAVVDGERYESDGLRIVVLGDGASDATSSLSPPEDEGDSLSGARYDSRAFLRTVVEPQTAFLGQQIDVAIYLYTSIGIANRSVTPTKPRMDGFWVYDEPIRNLDSDLVTVNGRRFRRYLVNQAAIFPQRTGSLTIDAPKITFETGGLSLFDSGERKKLTGVAVPVEVKPLPPPGAADTFVGNIVVQASLDRTDVQTGNAVTLEIRAAGRGNLQDLRIALPPIDGVRTLQPTIKDERLVNDGDLGGIRTWEWLLIPETPGVHVIPSITVPFFDARTERYGSTSTKELRFTAEGNRVSVPAGPTVEPVDVTPRPDFAFGPIRVYSALSRESTPVRKRAWFPWLLAFPPTLFVLLTVGIVLARRREQGHMSADSVQRRLLHRAKRALQDQDPRGFYDGIVAALSHAISTHTGQAVRGLPNAELRSTLADAGFDDDLVERVINELEGADFARFAASGTNTEEMERCLERSSTIIERIRRLEATS